MINDGEIPFEYDRGIDDGIDDIDLTRIADRLEELEREQHFFDKGVIEEDDDGRHDYYVPFLDLTQGSAGYQQLISSANQGPDSEDDDGLLELFDIIETQEQSQHIATQQSSSSSSSNWRLKIRVDESVLEPETFFHPPHLLEAEREKDRIFNHPRIFGWDYGVHEDCPDCWYLTQSENRAIRGGYHRLWIARFLRVVCNTNPEMDEHLMIERVKEWFVADNFNDDEKVAQYFGESAFDPKYNLRVPCYLLDRDDIRSHCEDPHTSEIGRCRLSDPPEEEKEALRQWELRQPDEIFMRYFLLSDNRFLRYLAQSEKRAIKHFIHYAWIRLFFLAAESVKDMAEEDKFEGMCLVFASCQYDVKRLEEFVHEQVIPTVRWTYVPLSILEHYNETHSEEEDEFWKSVMPVASQSPEEVEPVADDIEELAEQVESADDAQEIEGQVEEPTDDMFVINAEEIIFDEPMSTDDDDVNNPENSSSSDN